MMTVNPVAAPVELSAALPEDVPAIAVLLREAGLPDEDFADHLAHFLVARRRGEIVGAVGFEHHGGDALLRSLVVAPALRDAGLGGRLVDRLIAEARAGGVKRFLLLTTTAERFFAKRGFDRTARQTVPEAIAATKEFNSLCPVSAVSMTRNLETDHHP
jgi:N-acetylglutamate synthase-like GNAT family acetyltransferase